MNIHNGRGQNLYPLNFAKELYLNFNLAQDHILKKTFIPEIVKEKIEEEKKVLQGDSEDEEIEISAYFRIHRKF